MSFTTYTHKVIHFLTDYENAVLFTGGVIGGYKSLVAGFGFIPIEISEHLPSLIMYAVHCVVGGFISLGCKKVFDSMFNKPKDH